MSETETPPAPARPFADRRAFPINYGLMQPIPGGVPGMRLAETERGGRAAVVVCTAFHKPVSRCFLPRSPEPAKGEG